VDEQTLLLFYASAREMLCKLVPGWHQLDREQFVYLRLFLPPTFATVTRAHRHPMPCLFQPEDFLKLIFLTKIRASTSNLLLPLSMQGQDVERNSTAILAAGSAACTVGRCHDAKDKV
jgi:hypothetical protein